MAATLAQMCLELAESDITIVSSKPAFCAEIIVAERTAVVQKVLEVVVASFLFCEYDSVFYLGQSLPPRLLKLRNDKVKNHFLIGVTWSAPPTLSVWMKLVILLSPPYFSRQNASN